MNFFHRFLESSRGLGYYDPKFQYEDQDPHFLQGRVKSPVLENPKIQDLTHLRKKWSTFPINEKKWSYFRKGSEVSETS